MTNTDDGGALMWDGWVLNPDGSIHHSVLTERATLPASDGVLVRLHHALCPEDARRGRARFVQLHLSLAEARALAEDLWAFSRADGRRLSA